MAQIIEDIIATDKQAREIVQKAQARREQIMNGAAAERDRLLKEGEEKLKKLKSTLNAEGNTFHDELLKRTAEELAAKKAELDELYNKSEEKWANDIFTRLTEIKQQ